ncbi:50S ribosomal protein L18 [Candidatus Woesearchaeota archaeon]|nr:50S ribosomal protein L18 [Candidatus Woesearchaeota archaeon]
MARTKYGKTRTVKYRRKRESKTNYKKRLALIKSGKDRLVIRKSLNIITVQIVRYNPDGDKVLLTSTSKDLHKLGWKLHKANLPSAYLTGLLLGTKAKAKGIEEAVIDLGLQIPIRGGRLFAALRGAIDSGLKITHSVEALPSDERISGKHIEEFAKILKEDKARYEIQFSSYIKDGVDPQSISKLFEDTKKKVSSQ